MRTHGLRPTTGLLAGGALVLLSGLGWADPMTAPVQAAGGGATADEYAKKSDLGVQIHGDARVRSDTRLIKQRRPNAVFNTRLRIGSTGQFIGGEGYWGFGLATNAGAAVSRNSTLGGGDLNGTAGASFGLDLAYLGFKPVPKLDLVVGKMKNPYWETDAVFDPDLTPEGLAVNFMPFHGSDKDVIRNVNLTVNYFPIRGAAAAKVADVVAQTFMTGGQFRMDVGQARLGAGLYYFSGLNHAGAGTNAMAQALNQTTTGTAAGAFFNDKMTVVTGKVRVPFSLKGCPLAVNGELIYNLAAHNTKQRYGYEFGLELPKIGQSSLALTWRELAENATFSAWSDSDLGEGSGYHSGARAKWSIPVNKSVDFAATYFHYDRFAPFSGAPKYSVNRLFIETQAKF